MTGQYGERSSVADSMTFDRRTDALACAPGADGGGNAAALLSGAPFASATGPVPMPGGLPADTVSAPVPQPPVSGLFDQIPDGVWRFDRQLAIVYANPAMIMAAAVPWSECGGRRLSAIEALRAYAPLWEAKLNAVFDSLESRSFKFTYPHPSGVRSFDVRLYLECNGSGEATHVTAIARDITVPRLALQATRTADAMVSTLLSSARSGMAILDRDLRYVRCNVHLLQLLGVEQRQLLGRRLDEAFDLGGQTDVMHSLRRMRDNDLRNPHQVEYQFCGGDFPWIRERRTPLFDARGQFDGVFITVERLDRERFAETSLAALRSALDSAGEMVLEIHRDGGIVDANETALAWLGYSREQLINLRLGAIDVNLDEDRFAQILDALMGRGAFQGETRYRTRMGSEFPVDVVLQRVEHGEREFIFLLVRDISERKRIETSLADYGERLSTIFNESPAGIVLLDVNFQVRRVNRAACSLLGQRENELLGIDPTALLHPEDREASMRQRSRLAIVGSSVTEEDRRLLGPDGNVAWVNLMWRALGKAEGDREYLLVLENFTERKRYEERLQRLLTESRLIFDTALVGLLFLRDGSVLRVNAAMEELLGAESGTLVEQIQLFAHPSDRLLLAALGERYSEIQAKGACEFELYMYRRRGDPIWVAVQGRAVNPERPELGYIFAFVNIDQRKRSDRDLRATVNELQLIFDNALVSIVYVANDIVIKANAASERLFGLRGSDLGDIAFSSLFLEPDAWIRVQGQCSGTRPGLADGALHRAGEGASFELPMRRGDGEVFWCAGNVRPIEPGAPERGMIVALTDVDLRRQSEDELRRVRNHLDLVIESLPVLVSVREAESGRFVSINRAGEALTGLSRQQVVGRTWRELYGRQFAELYAEMDRKAIAQAQQIDRPRDVMLRADGRVLTVNQRVVPIFDEHQEGRDHGAAHYVMSIIDDLTGEVLAETALRETETRFRQFAENIDQMVFIAKADLSQVYYVNDRYGQLVGAPPAELLSDVQTARAHVHPDDLTGLERQWPRLVVKLRRLRRCEFSLRVVHPVSGVRMLNVRLNPARIHDGSIRVFGIADDVTERQAAEQQRLEEAVTQRDVLVREVHHRIKNNLQGVAGLLQQMASAKPEVAPTLNEVAGQIQAIAQVHGLQIGTGGTLPVLGVAQGIFSNLGAMFGADVRFESDAPGLWRWGLPENEAVPLALVINELGTNAIKYRSSRDLAIEVQIMTRPDGIALQIDNAGRLPVGFDLSRVSSGVSGLSLIKALLPRRGARLRIEQLGSLVRTTLELGGPAIREELE
jgi:PAS domain S-box-containing protein